MNTKYIEYEQPGVTVDLVIFTVDQDALKVMAVKRAEEPFSGYWSLPGGFLQLGESLDAAALRILEEKTAVQDVYLEQLYTFGKPNRDPRARVITVAYFALIPWKHLGTPPSRKVIDVAWQPVVRLSRFAFDHKDIVNYAVQRLRAKAGYSNIVYGLLPEEFRLSDLQKMYEVILNKQLDKRNFRKRMLAAGLLQETGKREVAGAHRPAMLYRFKKMEIAFLD